MLEHTLELYGYAHTEFVFCEHFDSIVILTLVCTTWIDFTIDFGHFRLVQRFLRISFSMIKNMASTLPSPTKVFHDFLHLPP